MRIFKLATGIAAFSLVSAVAGGAFAADPGTLQQVTGSVTITGADNVARKASAKDVVQPGDTIVTDAKSETLIKMADNTTIALRPNTSFQVTAFKYEKAPTDSAIVKVLRGTARFITGLIGKNNPRNMHVTAATATIGIRGTDFEVAVIPEDTADVRAGVYDFVRDGQTNIQLTQSGQNLDVNKGQTAFAPDKPKPGEEALQILRETPIFLQSGGGLDAIIQSITITIPMMMR